MKKTEVKYPGKHRKVPFFPGNWIAGFRGFKLMEIKSNLFSRMFQMMYLYSSVLQNCN